MRKARSTILYIFITLIILTGIALFIFKDDITNQFLKSSSDNLAVAVPSTANDLNLDILRDSRIKALKDNVTVFDYADLNKTQDALEAAAKKISDVIISNPDQTGTPATTTLNTFIRVRVGNSNPFIVNKIVK